MNKLEQIKITETDYNNYVWIIKRYNTEPLEYFELLDQLNTHNVINYINECINNKSIKRHYSCNFQIVFKAVSYEKFMNTCLKLAGIKKKQEMSCNFLIERVLEIIICGEEIMIERWEDIEKSRNPEN